MNKPINRITAQDLDTFVENPTLEEYQRISSKSAIYPGQGTPLGLAYCALKLNGEAGEFAEHVGKAMRDDALIPVLAPKVAGFVTADLSCSLLEERKRLLIKEVGDVLWYLGAICNELGITLEDAATANLQKLWDRTERDKLRGSGDER